MERDAVLSFGKKGKEKGTVNPVVPLHLPVDHMLFPLVKEMITKVWKKDVDNDHNKGNGNKECQDWRETQESIKIKHQEMKKPINRPKN